MCTIRHSTSFNYNAQLYLVLQFMTATLPVNCWFFQTTMGQTKALHKKAGNETPALMSVRLTLHMHAYKLSKTIPSAVERLLRSCCGGLCPVKMKFTLWAQICWLPSSDTPQRGSAIRSRVALSSLPVMGRRDNHWNSLRRDRERQNT